MGILRGVGVCLPDTLQCSNQEYGSFWVLYVFASLSGLAYMGALTTLTTLVGETFGMANIGKVLGALNMSSVLAAFVGPLLGGVAYDTRGTYRPAFTGVVVAAGIAAVLILRIKAVPVSETETV